MDLNGFEKERTQHGKTRTATIHTKLHWSDEHDTSLWLNSPVAVLFRMPCISSTSLTPGSAGMGGSASIGTHGHPPKEVKEELHSVCAYHYQRKAHGQGKKIPLDPWKGKWIDEVMLRNVPESFFYRSNSRARFGWHGMCPV